MQSSRNFSWEGRPDRRLSS